MTQHAAIGVGDADGEPYQLREHRRRGRFLDQRLLEDDPGRAIVDQARVLIETGRLKAAFKILSLPHAELAFRAGVPVGTAKPHTGGRRLLPYTQTGAAIGRQVIAFCEKADERASA